MSHLNNLEKNITDLKKLKILDLGCGKGNFMIEAEKFGCDIIGLEKNKKYIEIACKRGVDNKCELNIINGESESLPFEKEEFDFVNISEVIEHVSDPVKSLKEIHRVLKLGGQAYLSVPNRYSLKDPHYHLYLINWMPRKWAEKLINFLNKEKANNEAGIQKLSQMHYYTFSSVKNILKNIGFEVVDNRKRKILEKKLIFFLPLYYLFRFFYFDTFHLYLKKK